VPRCFGFACPIARFELQQYLLPVTPWAGSNTHFIPAERSPAVNLHRSASAVLPSPPFIP